MTDSFNEPLNVEDARELEATMQEVNALAKEFSSELSKGLQTAVTSGKDLQSILSQVALNLSSSALNSALKPLESLLSAGISSATGGATGITPFAKGGVVSSPTMFAAGSTGLGLMGEAGAEAILPLQRGSDGRLGVAMNAGSNQPSVTINVATQDVRSFERSQGQIAMIMARATGRGRRGL
ncbi:Phage MINOR TAIL PROTEIN [Pseudovibrio sp. FO-BEG1]|uniref:phage tail tape measure protein n=1 Tax=Pseudovibrio sp. (strain FO-BEG1) TaxID=911045 RepID=UPI000238D1BC|nr:phage tail tape measure protein [Pseudovibrio sp. FO-BEG1]AEV36977.1 Phage MINOR TAIL PROTEIN [Pseudovibrio sp. FO-BEG1]